MMEMSLQAHQVAKKQHDRKLIESIGTSPNAEGSPNPLAGGVYNPATPKLPPKALELQPEPEDEPPVDLVTSHGLQAGGNKASWVGRPPNANS